MGLERKTLGPLDTWIVDCASQPRIAVGFLHGYTMSAADLAPSVAALRLPAVFLVPDAPLTVDTGGRSWWTVDAEARAHRAVTAPRDLAAYDPPGRQDARRCLAEWLHAWPVQYRSLPLVLAGFSQGAMLALDAVLMDAVPASGLALLSASRIAMDDWAPRLSAIHGLPMLLTHGRSDPDLAFSAGERLADACRAGGADVTFQGFEGAHEMPLIAWRALQRYLLGLCNAVPAHEGPQLG